MPGAGPDLLRPSPARRQRLRVWTPMPPAGRVWRRRAAHRDPAGTGQGRGRRRGGLRSPGWAGFRIGWPGWAGACIPRRLHTLVLLLWSFPRTSSPGSRRVSDSLTCSAVALLPVSQVGSVLNWNEVPPGSRRGRSRVMVNWFQGRCFWQSLRNSGTESEG